MRRPLAAAVLLAAVLSAGMVGAVTQCAGGRVTVEVADPPLEARICRAADTGLAQLAGCGLGLRTPVRIEVTDRLENPHPGCLGRFDCATGQIQLLSPPAVRAALSGTSELAEIDGDAFYDSLVVHELAHAGFHQVSPLQDPSPAAQEYIAYAMQLAALPAAERARFLARAGQASPGAVSELSSVVLAFSPSGFAARAWLHFAEPENGCSFVAKLVDGRERLVFPGY